MAEKTQRRINLATDQYFSCTSCGKCCISTWLVKVEPEKVPIIESTLAFKQLEREGYVPLALVDGERRIGRRESGHCYFLTTTGCQIHSELDGFQKPTVCQQYPFNLVNTPDGFFVSLSYSCPAALAGTGELVNLQQEDLERTIAESPYHSQADPSGNSTIMLTESKQISWTEYCQLEPTLLAAIGSVDPVYDLVILAVSLLESEAERVLSSEALKMLPIFAHNAMSVMERETEHAERKGFTQALQDGTGVHSNLLGQSITSFRLCQPPDLISKQVLNRYVRNIIWGKRLISGQTVVTRLLMLATALSLLLFYLEERSAHSKELHFEFSQLEWAFDLIETNLFTHTEDLQPLFLEYERALVAISSALGAA